LALIQGTLPSRREWKRIVRDDLGVNVLQMPGAAVDLGGLRPFASRIRHLTVNSASCRDLSDVALMSELRSLAVGGLVDVGADLRLLRNLESFGGPIESFDGVLDHPTIVSLAFEWSSATPPHISAGLESLSVGYSNKTVGLPTFDDSTRLRTMAIDGASTLSLAGIESCSALTRLDLTGCRAIEDAERLLMLPSLQRLWFENCLAIEPQTALLDLVDVEVGVIGRNPFAVAFRSAAAESNSKWSFPSLPRPKV
jgi:hypothetical protein